MAYDTGGLSTAQIKEMQSYYGTTADGLWGPNSTASAGGKSVTDAWNAYQAAQNPTTTPAATEQTAVKQAAAYTPKGDASQQPTMSAADQQSIANYQAIWAQANESGDAALKQWAHDQAEAVRAGYEFSGGGDGSEYLPFEKKAAAGSQLPAAPTSDLPTRQQLLDEIGGVLDKWQTAAQQGQELKIDYATQQGIRDLERAQEDAQAMFKTQQEQIARDEMNAKDNAALYAELRGDKGGIGKEQYSAVENTAAINRQTVASAQTKLATDTARQIADLRAQGEFEKANALLELSQTYLSQLMQLHQWAAEYGLSSAQFLESIREWEAEYQLKLSNLTGYMTDGTPTFDREQWQYSNDASLVNAILSAGGNVSDDRLAAIGMTREEAEAIRLASQAKSATYTSGPGTSPQSTQSWTLDDGKVISYADLVAAAKKSSYLTTGSIEQELLELYPELKSDKDFKSACKDAAAEALAKPEETYDGNKEKMFNAALASQDSDLNEWFLNHAEEFGFKSGYGFTSEYDAWLANMRSATESNLRTMISKNFQSYAEAEAKINAALGANYITSAQASSLLSEAATRFGAVVNSPSVKDVDTDGTVVRRGTAR